MKEKSIELKQNESCVMKKLQDRENQIKELTAYSSFFSEKYQRLKESLRKSQIA